MQDALVAAEEAEAAAKEEAIVAANSAEEQHEAELARDPADAATGDATMATMVDSGTGTDADAGEYKRDDEGTEPEAIAKKDESDSED